MFTFQRVADGLPPRVADGLPPSVVDGLPPRVAHGLPPRSDDTRAAYNKGSHAQDTEHRRLYREPEPPQPLLLRHVTELTPSNVLYINVTTSSYQQNIPKDYNIGTSHIKNKLVRKKKRKNSRKKSRFPPGPRIVLPHIVNPQKVKPYVIVE